jgi:hypothetical protein
MLHVLLAFAALQVTASTVSGAQQYQTTSYVVRDSCRNCPPSFREKAVLGSDGPGVGPLRSVGEDGAGRFYLAHDYSASAIAVYAPNGRFQRTIGRQGRGPGEYRRISRVHTFADTVFVYDEQERKEDAYAGSGPLRFVRTRPVPLQVYAALPMRDGTLLVNSDVRAPGAVAAPFHVVGPDGQIVRSFPDGGGRFRYDEAHLLSRAMARASDTTFWAAHETQYVLELWSVSGRKLAELDRVTNWFIAHQSRPSYSRDSEPKPRVRAIYYDSDVSRIWVAIWVADRRWKEQLSNRGGETLLTGRISHFFDSIIEVIDVDSRRVVAAGRYDHLIAGFTDAGSVVVYDESEAAEPLLRIWTAESAGHGRSSRSRR